MTRPVVKVENGPGQDLSGANCTSQRCNGFQMHRTRMQDADFSATSFRGALFDSVEGSKAKFGYSSAHGLTVVDSKLDESEWQAALLQGASFATCNLTDADFTNVMLCGATFDGCRLHRVKFQHSDLRGVRMIDCRGAGTIFTGDPRGWVTVYVEHGEPRSTRPDKAYGRVFPAGDLSWDLAQIYAGCRSFSLEEALLHWGPEYQGNRGIGDRYVRALLQFASEDLGVKVPPPKEWKGCSDQFLAHAEKMT